MPDTGASASAKSQVKVCRTLPALQGQYVQRADGEQRAAHQLRFQRQRESAACGCPEHVCLQTLSGAVMHAVPGRERQPDHPELRKLLRLQQRRGAILQPSAAHAPCTYLVPAQRVLCQPHMLTPNVWPCRPCLMASTRVAQPSPRTLLRCCSVSRCAACRTLPVSDAGLVQCEVPAGLPEVQSLCCFTCVCAVVPAVSCAGSATGSNKLLDCSCWASTACACPSASRRCSTQLPATRRCPATRSARTMCATASSPPASTCPATSPRLPWYALCSLCAVWCDAAHSRGSYLVSAAGLLLQLASTHAQQSLSRAPGCRCTPRTTTPQRATATCPTTACTTASCTCFRRAASPASLAASYGGCQPLRPSCQVLCRPSSSSCRRCSLVPHTAGSLQRSPARLSTAIASQR